MSLVAAVSVGKSFAGINALQDVSFELNAGEVHALVGENGAGKSTLVKILTGASQLDSGTVAINGEPVSHHTPASAHAAGIAAIYQQPALFPELSVAENIALHLENGSLWRRVDWKHRKREARDLLERAGASIDPETPVRELSMPEQQLVEIAKALGTSAGVLILDEPTATLTDREVDRLFRLIRELRQQGKGIVYVSHRLDELFSIADRATVLRDGRVVGTRAMGSLDRQSLIQMMVGREVAALFPKRTIAQGDVILETRKLGCRATGIHDVTLQVRAGEIFGIAGLVGSGRTELANILFGLTPGDGKILLRGRPAIIASPQQAVRLGLGYTPEDRRHFGAILPMSIAANTTLASLPAIASHGFLDFGEERDVSLRLARQLEVKAPSIFTPVANLSGGNQQKVVLARWLATKPAVMILDEPTQGVDVSAKAEIHGLIGELAAAGTAIILISSELPEILGMSDRIAVMRSGTIVATLPRAEATPEKLLALALGHPVEETAA
jgi:rhamnose transport system ATP-binding protein